jgi:hypothetical protein
MVESVLGLILLVSVLLFGIYFGEIGFLTLKVQEAAYGALWEASGQRMHDTSAGGNGNWTLYRQAIRNGQEEAQTTYAGYDAAGGNTSSLSQVMSAGSPVAVSCTAVEGNFFSNLGVRRPTAAGSPLHNSFPDEDSGISCMSQAVLSSTQLPSSFLDNEPFQVPHWRNITVRACSTGRATGATCPGRLVMLLDDWGFSGQEEGQECGLNREGNASPCANPGFFRMVRDAYNQGGLVASGAACDFAQAIAGQCPLPGNGENQFFMSFRGSESLYRESNVSRHGTPSWETSPFIEGNYNVRSPSTQRCWLGKPCG